METFAPCRRYPEHDSNFQLFFRSYYFGKHLCNGDIKGGCAEFNEKVLGLKSDAICLFRRDTQDWRTSLIKTCHDWFYLKNRGFARESTSNDQHADELESLQDIVEMFYDLFQGKSVVEWHFDRSKCLGLKPDRFGAVSDILVFSVRDVGDYCFTFGWDT